MAQLLKFFLLISERSLWYEAGVADSEARHFQIASNRNRPIRIESRSFAGPYFKVCNVW